MMLKGLVHIYCGDGKGKTTAAIGLAVRCAGGGGRVLFVSFLKDNKSGERNALKNTENIELIENPENVPFYKFMNEKEKKNPRLPAWKVWILIIVTVQLISAIQNHRIHQQMWEVLNQQGYYLIQSLELQSENNQVSRRLFDQILEYLQALR